MSARERAREPAKCLVVHNDHRRRAAIVWERRCFRGQIQPPLDVATGKANVMSEAKRRQWIALPTGVLVDGRDRKLKQDGDIVGAKQRLGQRY